MREWLARLGDWLRRDRLESDLNEELRFHREQLEREARAAGASDQGAIRAARRRLGALSRAREEVRDRWSWPWLDHFQQDVRYALRGLRRTPGLTAAIVVTLGLGVGANAAVFAALDRVFFQAPPGVKDPGAIRRLYAHNYSKEAPWYGPTGEVTSILAPRDLRDFQEALRGTAAIAGDALDHRAKLDPGNQPVLISFVSLGYFELLGVRPGRGRFFGPEENRPGHPVPVAVISDALWRNHFSSDSAILGKTVKVDETRYSVVGVAAPGFNGADLEAVDLWVPLSNLGEEHVGLRLLLRPDRGAQGRAFDQRLTAQYRQTHLGDRWVEARSEIVTAPILVARGPAMEYQIPGMADRSLALLPRLAGVSLGVLVIAVANVASLLLMRAIRRRREIAVRLALGVSRGRLVRQLVTESTILALVAGAVALLVAALTGNALRSQLATFRWSATVIDPRVVLVAMGMAIVGGMAAGLAPAAFAIRTDVSSTLKAASAGASGAGSALRLGLLVTQSGLCMALLACGGVFLQSLRRAGDFDRGFDPELSILLWVPAYYPTADEEIVRVAERLRGVPGVEAVGRTFSGLSENSGISAMVGSSTRDTVGVGPRGPSLDFVEPEFMRAAGLRVLAGRPLAPADNTQPVVVINQALAQRLWRRGQAVGSCIHIRQPRSSPCRTVIGVVRDFRWDVGGAPVLRVYLPMAQAWTRPDRSFMPNYLVVRMRAPARASDVAALRGLVVPMISGGEADLEIGRVTDFIAPRIRPWRLAAGLFLLLGALGLAAAAAGIYGLVSYDVAQRSRELGVRITLGASSGSILRLVIGSGLRLVLMGVAGGVVAALVAGRFMASLLFGTSPYDPAVLGMTTLTLAGAATLASVIPAWRATRVDPVIVLSAE